MSEELKIDNETGEVIEDGEIKSVGDLDKTQRQDNKSEVEDQAFSKQIELELKRGYREKVVEPYGTIRINRPTIEDDYHADLIYAETYTKLMDQGSLKNMDELEVQLKNRGLYDKIDPAKTDELRKEFQEVTAELFIARQEHKRKASSNLKAKIQKLANEQSTLRKEILHRESTRSKYSGLTIEGRSDEQRLMYRLHRCISYPDGKRVWETLDDLKKEKDAEHVAVIVFEFISFTQGLDPRVLREIPDFLEEVGDVT